MNKIKCLISFFILIFICDTYSQPYDFTCGTPTGSSKTVSSPFAGYYKPNRTDLDGSSQADSAAFYPVLVVFVQYKDEGGDAWWPQNAAPIYLDSMISPIKRHNTDWWDAYNPNKETISDYWLEVSRGKLHMVGQAYSVVLDSTYSYYLSLGTGGDAAINNEIWRKLCAPGIGIDWTFYDKWKDSSGGRFYYQPDGFVDCIYKIQKSDRGVYGGYYGFACLSWHGMADVKVDSVNNIFIRHSYSEKGSGMTVAGYTKKALIMGTIEHEHGHNTYAPGHITYGKVSYGVGFDGYYSPYEMVANEYMTPTTITEGTNYLADYSSRDEEDGNLFKVPIQGNEFFLLANRTKVSNYDRVMLGDTALYNPRNAAEYGKGLYIYHVQNGCARPSGDISPQDMECADGYYQWSKLGTDGVYIDCNTISGFDVFKKLYPRYDNDSSRLHTRSLKGDGLSLHYFLYNHPNNGQPVSATVKFGEGQKPASNCDLGTDRLFTNMKENYTTFEHMGDRFDAWQPGYNEVFSPYSSPSTCAWNSDYTGIFIWYSGIDHDRADLKIYKDKAAGGETDIGEILEATPPSRPMNLQAADTCADDPNNGHARILLTWNHNMEPDMNRTIGEDTKKRYKIYRSLSSSLSTVPPDALTYSEYIYSHIATVDIDTGDIPSYLDTANCFAYCNENNTNCPPYCWNAVNARYRVQAVDVYNDVSVLSDFVSCKVWIGYTSIGGGDDEQDRPAFNHANEIPDRFTLHQNYPNPFNPVTNIQYDLPRDNFVAIKIYDIMGREVMQLINEFKPAGRYVISFNANKLASGVYFYKIEATDFVDTKRMVLVK